MALPGASPSKGPSVARGAMLQLAKGPSRGPVKAAVPRGPARGPRPVIAANNPLLNPNAQLSGRSLLQAGQALVNAQVNPTIAELRSQLGQNDAQTAAQQKQDAGYFGQLGQSVQQGLDQQKQIGSTLQNTLKGIAGTENQALQGAGQNAMQTLQKYTPGGIGTDSGANTALTAEIARQQGLAAQNQANLQSFGATQSAGNEGLGASQLGTFAKAGQETLGRLATAGELKGAPLEARIAAAIASKGPLLSTALGKLRQQEIGNQVTRQTLGIHQQQAQTTAQNDAAKNKLGYAQITAANGRNAATNAAAAARQAASASATATRQQAALNAKNGAAAGKGALTPEKQLAQYQIIDKLGPKIDAMKAGANAAVAKLTGKPVGYKFSDQEITQLFGQEYGPLYVQAAYEMRNYGHITGTTARGLYGLGLRGSHFKVAPAPAPPPGAGQVVGTAVNQVTAAEAAALAKILGVK